MLLCVLGIVNLRPSPSVGNSMDLLGIPGQALSEKLRFGVVAHAAASVGSTSHETVLFHDRKRIRLTSDFGLQATQAMLDSSA